MMTAEEKWVYEYHLNPIFDEGAVMALRLAEFVSKNGTRQNMGSVMSVSGFLGQSMARFPDRFEEWVTAYRDRLGMRDQGRRSILWFAIALSGLDDAVRLLERLESINQADEEERMAAITLARLDVRSLEPKESWMLDLLWGCYFGSADRSFILEILKCVPWITEDGAAARKINLGRSAYWSIDSNRKALTNVDADVMILLSENPDLSEAYSFIYEAATTFDPHTS